MINWEYTLIGEGFKYKEPVNIGGYGFHLSRQRDGSYLEDPHNFKVRIGDNVSFGAFANVDRGSWRDTIIGDGVKTDAHIHIAHNCLVGNHVTMGVNSTLLGSVEVGDYSTIWSGAIIHQHIKVGKNCLVGANSYLRHDLPDEHVAYGSPAIIKHRKDVKYPFVRYGV